MLNLKRFAASLVLICLTVNIGGCFSTMTVPMPKVAYAEVKANLSPDEQRALEAKCRSVLKLTRFMGDPITSISEDNVIDLYYPGSWPVEDQEWKIAIEDLMIGPVLQDVATGGYMIKVRLRSDGNWFFALWTHTETDALNVMEAFGFLGAIIDRGDQPSSEH